MATAVAHLRLVGHDAAMTHKDVSHQLLDDYLTWCRSWGAAPSTIKMRASVLSRVLVQTDSSTAGLAAWLAGYESPWTRATYFATLRSFYGWAASADHLPADPTRGLRRPRSPKGVPRPLSQIEVRAVLAEATGRAAAYVRLGLYAGLRAHEVAKIAGEDIDADLLYVVGKGGQTAMIPTHPELWALAQTMPRRGLWFPSPSRPGEPVTSSAVSLAVSTLLRGLGIEGSHHRLRHTYGTNLLRAGASLRTVQELMRHESVTSTQIYTAVSAAERVEAIRRLAA